MAFPPKNPSGYRPDPLASGGATEKPLAEAGAPKGSSGIYSSLMRIAFRRLPAHGFGATKQTQGVKPPSNALTMGSHGKIS